ncbi:MAG: hypothetical protein EVA73_04760 [Limisphaerales bacterium]|nr:MAG: hypothetical protein EVA73_04760 [Limisphaerales bacterium]
MRFLIFILLSPVILQAAEFPDTLFLRTSDLQRKKQLIHEDALYKAAYEDLLQRADRTLGKPLYSVMSKTLTPDSGDKHDYMSFGPYWWPDPKKEDGLPFINRDGEVNPASRDSRSDRPKLSALTDELKILSMAYYLSEDNKYSERGAALINTWFLDKQTRMNPNLNYGQAIPGRTKGRGIGIIETRKLDKIVDALILFSGSKEFTDDIIRGTKKWLNDYLTWLLTSKNGQDEAKTKNNHGTWYDFQVAALALYCDRKDDALTVFKRVDSLRIPKQIKEDGSQPHELARTRSFDYSKMNIQGFLQLARLAEHLDFDLWNSNEKRLLKAVLFLEPYSNEEMKWPHKQIKTIRVESLFMVLKLAAPYKNKKIDQSAMGLTSKAGLEILFY